MLRVAVAGASGRVGRLLVPLIYAAEDLELAAALGRDDRVLPACDVLIDFSTPPGLRHWLGQCRQSKVAFVSGTTPLDDEADRLLDAASAEIAVLHATNTSLGVALLNRLAADAARVLGPAGFDLVIVETHHRGKKDAPSGTARTLADRVERVAGRAVPVASLRVGDVVGEHALHLAGDGERLTLTHAATSRETFARGALRAARWLAGRPAGRHGIDAVLDLPSAGGE